MIPSLIYLAVSMVVVLIVQVGFYLLIKRFAKEWSGQKTANSVLFSIPAFVTFAAIIILHSFSSFGGQPPPGIESVEPINSIEQAAKRINSLEGHTAYLENYLVYERRRQLILVIGLSAMFLLPLVAVGLGMYKPTDDEQ